MSDLRQLIEAARADGPSAAARAKVWGGVSSTVGEAAAAAGSAAGSIGAVKMLVLGTLLGGAMTVGIGAAVLVAWRTPPATGEVRGAAAMAAPAPALEPTTVAWAANDDARRVPGSLRDERRGAPFVVAVRETALPDESNAVAIANAPAPAILAVSPVSPVSAAAPAVPGVPGDVNPKARASHGVRNGSRDDALAREASTIAAARAALGHSDALAALQLVRGLRTLPDRQLIPEELAVEAQALRALGLTDDAIEVDTTLRVRFPDSVLER